MSAVLQPYNLQGARSRYQATLSEAEACSERYFVCFPFERQCKGLSKKQTAFRLLRERRGKKQAKLRKLVELKAEIETEYFTVVYSIGRCFVSCFGFSRVFRVCSILRILFLYFPPLKVVCVLSYTSSIYRSEVTADDAAADGGKGGKKTKTKTKGKGGDGTAVAAASASASAPAPAPSERGKTGTKVTKKKAKTKKPKTLEDDDSDVDGGGKFFDGCGRPWMSSKSPFPPHD